jgi:hypothetical protein
MTQVTTPRISKNASGDTSRRGRQILWSEVKPPFLDARTLDSQFAVHGGDDDPSRPRFSAGHLLDDRLGHRYTRTSIIGAACLS